MSVYEMKELIPQTFFQKLLKKYPKQNYLIELENLLCKNEDDVLSIKMSDVNSLKNKYKIKDKLYQYEREFLLDRFISRCLWDERLSDSEKKQLSHLANILDVSEEYMNKRVAEEGKIILRKKVKLVIADNKIENSEKEELDALEKEFNISENDYMEILSKEVSAKLQEYVNAIILKRRMSPEEEAKFNEMVAGMHVNLKLSENGLSRFRKYWEIENSDLIPIQSPINIQKGENLFFSDKIEWFEERTRTTSVSYGGIGTRFKICKGVYLRAGSIAPSRNTEQYMKLIDTGIIYFTNKRIIFMGQHSNKVIMYSKILSFTTFSNGVEIDKETGKKPFIKTKDSELMGIYLARLLKDY
ncbi:MAG: hypothetical protein IKQ43_10620 [Treponema sp.]|nr:hypothetical protein [Treponema sp.]